MDINERFSLLFSLHPLLIVSTVFTGAMSCPPSGQQCNDGYPQTVQQTPGAVWPTQPCQPYWPYQPTQSAWPMNAGTAVPPTWPVQPIQSSWPYSPTNQPIPPFQPSQQFQPSQPFQPSQQFQPSQPLQPSPPVQQNPPVQPNQPSPSVQLSPPFQPSQPVQPSPPVQQNPPAQPNQPAQLPVPSGYQPSPVHPTWHGNPGQPGWPCQGPTGGALQPWPPAPSTAPVTVPFNMNFPRGIYDKLMLTIRGQIKPDAKMFTINFLRGNDIALHINPRFSEGGKPVLVRNHKVGERWGPEERDLLAPFPFTPGHHFEIKILCTVTEFKVAVNNTPIFNFHHRITEVNQIDRVNILHDITLTSVNLDSLP